MLISADLNTYTCTGVPIDLRSTVLFVSGRIVDIPMGFLRSIVVLPVGPVSKRYVLEQTPRQVRLYAEVSTRDRLEKNARTLLMNALPNAMSCPVSSATRSARSRV